MLRVAFAFASACDPTTRQERHKMPNDRPSRRGASSLAVTGFVYSVTSAVGFGGDPAQLKVADSPAREAASSLNPLLDCSAIRSVGVRAHGHPARLWHHLLPQQALGDRATRVVLPGGRVCLCSI